MFWKIRMRKVDLGHPFGVVEVPEGWNLAWMKAACGPGDHSFHSDCSPGWGEQVMRGGGIVIAGPVLDSLIGWKAAVIFPPEGHEDWLVKAIRVARSLPSANWINPKEVNASLAAFTEAEQALRENGIADLLNAVFLAELRLAILAGLKEAILTNILNPRDAIDFVRLVRLVYETDHSTWVR